MQLFYNYSNHTNLKMERVMNFKTETLNFIFYLNLIELINKGCPRTVLES